MAAIKKMLFDEFQTQLDNAATEEMVKSIYAQYFNIKYNTSNHHDL